MPAGFVFSLNGYTAYGCNRYCCFKYSFLLAYLLFLIAACAAASLAMGTRKGEQET